MPENELVPCADCKSLCESKPEMTVDGKVYCCTSERDLAIKKLEDTSPKDSNT